MAMASDDELDSPRTHKPSTSISRPARFNFDDAFSDTDDQDVDSFEFSPAAIRAELQKNLNHEGADHRRSWGTDHDLNDIIAKIGYANGHEADDSVSTFDIDAGHNDELSPPMQQPPSPSLSRSASHIFGDDAQSFDDVTLASDFSSVNLQSPQSEAGKPLEPDVEEEERPQYAEYPAVQIDVSAKHPQPTIVQVATPPAHTSVRSLSPSTPPHDDQTVSSATSTSSHPVTPRSAHASVPSLSMPASSSLPTPTSAQYDIPAIPAPSSKHRVTRSAGPSMLDKVVSKTRPSFLPPKPKQEDIKHMADWEKMMKQSRAAGELELDIPPALLAVVNQLSMLMSFCSFCFSIYLRNLYGAFQRRNDIKRCRSDGMLERSE